MKFEWDQDKSKTNLRKHKLDFQDAEQVFRGLMLIKLDTRSGYGEDRYIGFGHLKERLVCLIYTEPAPDVIRIISLRKANKREQALFEREIKNRLGQN